MKTHFKFLSAAYSPENTVFLIANINFGMKTDKIGSQKISISKQQQIMVMKKVEREN